jgi:membrane bound O-acyltransferase family protein
MPLTEPKRVQLSKAEGKAQWIGWIPIAVMPPAVAVCCDRLQPWKLMWCLSFAIFAGLKWLTWWKARSRITHAKWRSVAYILAWPGMDADAFLDQNRRVRRPTRRDWFGALFKTAAGASLIWIVARYIPAREPLVQGWVGMLGLILLLHFGSFEVVALFWQSIGVNASPIMSAPLRSTSLSEFWGERWNLGFRQLSYDLVFRPLLRICGAGVASFLVFLASGLIHDFVISFPARGGYGLPTTYFMLQGVGVTIEHSNFGKRLGLRNGLRGWLFTAAFAAGPVLLLFHRLFVLRVILPFMEALHAI